MALSGKIRRRIFGALCVTAAMLLLLFGDTKLRPGQSQLLFVTYWAACFIFAVLAMITAICDARALRRELRDEQRALLEDALRNIESEKRGRSNRVDPASNSADLRD